MARGFRFGGAGGSNVQPIVFPPSARWTSQGSASQATISITDTAMTASNLGYTEGTNQARFSVPLTPVDYDRRISFTTITNGSMTIAYWINGIGTALETVTGTGTVRTYTIDIPVSATSFAIGFSNSWGASVNLTQTITNVSEYLPVKLPLIYDRGSWSVAYDNPGSYVYSGVTTYGATLEPFDIQFVGSSSAVRVIGTANKVDLTNYNLLKFRCKSVGGSMMRVEVRDNKTLSIAPELTSGLVPASNDYVEYVVDISSLSGEHYIDIWSSTSNGVTAYIDKIWLT